MVNDIEMSLVLQPPGQFCIMYNNDDVRAIINDLHPYASVNYNDMLREDNDAMDDDLL